jgi:hypothetical protein
MGVRVVRARVMSDAELVAAFDVAEEHVLLVAVGELIARAKDECAEQAAAHVESGRETAFYLGGRYGLEQLETYMQNLRIEATRKRAEANR